MLNLKTTLSSLYQANQGYKKIAMLAVLLASAAGVSCSDGPINEASQELTVINSRESFQVATDLEIASLQTLSAAYKQQTGVDIEWVALDKSIFTTHFDDESPLHATVELPQGVDMLLMHSAYSLADASSSLLLQPLGSEILNSTVPQQYLDPEGEWFGVSTYGRTIVYNQRRVSKVELNDYAALSEPKWFGRLCMTDIYNAENQAIAKTLMSYRGATATPEILAGWRANIARPSANDKAVLDNIEQGRCDIGLVDSDIFWSYAKANPDTAIRLQWVNQHQHSQGTVTNAISMGIADSGEQVGLALRFMEWLVSDTGQALLAFHTSTFPVVDLQGERINSAAIRPDWTKFSANDTALSDIIEDHRRIDAISLPATEAKYLEAETDSVGTQAVGSH